MKPEEITMGIAIDPDVFNSAKTFADLKLDAIQAGHNMRNFVDKLAQAADIHGEGPRGYFQVMDLNGGSNAEHSNDFGIFFQNIIDHDDKIDGKAFLDFSFDVEKDQHHILRSACTVRFDSSLESDEETGGMKFVRADNHKTVLPTEASDTLANNLFMWFFERVPEDDHAAFLKNCEELGLADQKTKIGFGAELKSQDQAPSVH